MEYLSPSLFKHNAECLLRTWRTLKSLTWILKSFLLSSRKLQPNVEIFFLPLFVRKVHCQREIFHLPWQKNFFFSSALRSYTSILKKFLGFIVIKLHSCFTFSFFINYWFSFSSFVMAYNWRCLCEQEVPLCRVATINQQVIIFLPMRRSEQF